MPGENEPALLNTIIEPAAEVTKLNREPYRFTEGPANDGKGNLYFVDLQQNLIVRHDTNTGTFETWAGDTAGANGGIFLRDGRFLSCRGTARDVVLWREDGTVEQVLVSEYEGKPFNGPNDLVVSRSGWIYFTDPDFEGHRSLPEGVYALSPRGELMCIAQGIARPNGIVLSPDETVLIINGTAQKELIAYDVTPDGRVTNRRVFATVADPDRKRYPGYPEVWWGCDGMAVDREGNLYVTTGAGVQVFDVRGSLMGILAVPEKPTNVCFGGPENKTLYITAQSSLYSVRCRIAGVVFQQ